MSIKTKENILSKIRNGLIQHTTQPFPSVDQNSPLYKKAEEPLDILFAQEFTKLQGSFVYCENKASFVKQISALADEKKWENLFCWEFALQQIFQEFDFKKVKVGVNLEKAEVGITLVECLIARTGSLLLSTHQTAGRTLSIYPPVHIAVAYTNQLVYDIKDGLQLVMEKFNGKLPSNVTITSGPSRTADIEKTLVLGAHGPKEVYVFLIDQTS